MSAPSEASIDKTLTLEGLRTFEATILTATRQHEDELARLQQRYRRVRAKMYREHKAQVMAADNQRLGSFQQGCPKPKPRPTKEEADAQARCMQAEAQEVDESDLGRLMRRHLWTQPAKPAQCESFRQVSPEQMRPSQRECISRTGDARWTAAGLVDDTNGSSGSSCGRHWMGSGEARCLFGGKDVLFIGNSVVRRQLYTVLDVLAGPQAHRQLINFSSVHLPSFKDREAARRSWIWDRDNHTYGYHASQLFTIDLETGEHRFSMPHTELCGLGEGYSVFHPGRHSQWRFPGSGGGSEPIKASWKESKWAGREWRPLVSFHAAVIAELPAELPSENCAARQISWAGSSVTGLLHPPEDAVTAKPRRRRGASREGLATKLRQNLLRQVRTHFAALPSADLEAMMANVSVHIEFPGDPNFSPGGDQGGIGPWQTQGRRGAGTPPNVWLYFPTYHGESERFFGFCEDHDCSCTGKLAACHHHPECRNKHECAPKPPGSAVFVERARSFSATLASKAKLMGGSIDSVRLTPFYEDCWAKRGRCQGFRPCREPVDQAWTCRATSMLCPAAGPGGWPAALRAAKAWIPSGHASASLLYLFDGQTNELLDETFSTWTRASVGYGSHAIIFGPQFGSFHGASAWRHTLGQMRSAVRRADACLGRRTLLIFRSPAFNFDPVNTPEQQAQFSRHMRPIVEESGMLYIDNYPSTYDAVFQGPPHAIKFAKNSAFHYLNAGRYLMAQLVLHVIRILAPTESLARL